MKHKRLSPPAVRFKFISLCIATCFSLFLPLLLSAQTAGRQTLSGHVPPAVTRLHLQPISGLPAAQPLKLAISLPLRNSDVLSNAMEQLYDPASPNYHRFLTPAEFTAQFGPSEEDYQQVMDFARNNGLTVSGTYSNRTLLEVSGTVADIERTFQVKLQVYQHPVENRTFYAPDVEPSLALSVPISGIIGLNNFHLPRPLYTRAVVANPSTNHLTGSAPDGSGSYFGSDFRSAYVPGTGLTGTGQTVALFECADYFPSDIATYLQLAKLPSVPLTNVLVGGGPAAPAAGDGVNVEVALDIEMAICMAPGLSKIIVYEGTNDTPVADAEILTTIATQNAAKQISSSWVITDDPVYATIYTQFAMQGQTFLQASGDEGSYYPGIFQFEDSPLVTLVGGTTLSTTGPGGAWAGEQVWNWNNGSAGGGGISQTYRLPSYQQGLAKAANQGSATHRNVPDVALTADNIFVVADDGLLEPGVGGTSCAAPLWAGFMALVNQQGAANGKSPLGFINPTVYTIGKGAQYQTGFHDIVIGNNRTPSNPDEFFAIAGYDLCSGWGTPNGTNLINLLLQPLDPLQVGPTNAFSTSISVGGPISGTVQNYTLTNIGPASINWMLTGTSAWLNVSQLSGTLAAGAHTTVTVGLNSSAASLPVGTVTTNLSFNDLNTGGNQTRGAVLQISPLLLNGNFAAGSFTNWVLSGNITNMYVTTASNFVYSGNYAARLGPVGSLGYLSQTVPTISGEGYVLSFWLENPDGGVTNEFSVAWNGNILYDQVNLPAFGWTNMQFNVTATGSTGTVQFGVRNDPHFFGLDDVVLTGSAPPSPSAPLTLAVGSISANQFTFSWGTSPGSIYQVQYVTNLSQPNWINLGGALTAADLTLSFTNITMPDPHRFYRLQVVP